MTLSSDHQNLVGTQIHDPFHYIQPTDPGAVGAGKFWLDTSSEPNIPYRRNDDDDGWITVGAEGGGTVPATYHAQNGSTRAHTENNAWTDVENTSITFTAEKDKYHVKVTFTFSYVRGGFWQILLGRISGTNTGTITPSQWTLDYNEGSGWATTRQMTLVFNTVIQPTIGASVTVKFQFNNSNTSNYITFYNTLVEVE